jgi:hypothetical protein
VAGAVFDSFLLPVFCRSSALFTHCLHIYLNPNHFTTANKISTSQSRAQVIRGSDKSEVFRKMWKSLDADGGGMHPLPKCTTDLL